MIVCLLLCAVYGTAALAGYIPVSAEEISEEVIIEDDTLTEDGAQDISDQEIAGQEAATEVSDQETVAQEAATEAPDPGLLSQDDSIVVDIQRVESDEYSRAADALMLEQPLLDNAAGEPQKEEETVTDTVTFELLPSGSADTAVPGYAFFTDSIYVDSYGGQLKESAAYVYGQMVQTYAVDQILKKIMYQPALINDPITFTLEMTIEQFENKEYKKTQAYQEALGIITYALQASYDAFLFDYPQVYWLAPPKVSFSMTAKEDPAKKLLDVAVSSVTITAQEAYEGAYDKRNEFYGSVSTAAAAISQRAGQGSTRRDTVEAIHDYICETAVYDYNYGSYPSGSAKYRMIHSAAGIFLDSERKAVCDGYAKAFMILCEKFGIPCAVIPGAVRADGVGHAWNYVQMEDGNWYLIDTTWDDKTPVGRGYFLVGGGTKNSAGVRIDEERAAYTNFSGSQYTKNFAVPALSAVHYHIHKKEYVSNNDATCMADGTKTYVCEVEGCGYTDTVTEEGTRLAHIFADYISDQNATCMADGTKTAQCARGCGTRDTVPEKNTRRTHKFEKYVSDQNATCMSDGTKTAQCVYGCGVRDTVPDAGTRIAHRFTEYRSDNNAGWYQDGTKTARCSYGCGVLDTVSEEGSAKIPTAVLNVTSLRLEKGQATSGVTVSGLCEGDSVIGWKTSDPSVVKVSKTGRIKAQKKTGRATVTAVLASGLEKKVKVKVQKKPVRTKTIAEVPAEITVKAGKKWKLKPQVQPFTSKEKLTFSTSKSSVAKVTKKGVVKALKKGKAVITVRSGKKTVKCIVKVKK